MRRLVIALVIVVAVFLFASAANGADPEIKYTPQFIGPLLGSELPKILENLYRYAVIVGLVGAVFFIIYRGFQYVTSEIPFVQQQSKVQIVAILGGIILLFLISFILGLFGIIPKVEINLPFKTVNPLPFDLPKPPTVPPPATSGPCGVAYGRTCTCSAVAPQCGSVSGYTDIKSCVPLSEPSCCKNLKDDFTGCAWPDRGWCFPETCGGSPLARSADKGGNLNCGLFIVAYACKN